MPRRSPAAFVPSAARAPTPPRRSRRRAARSRPGSRCTPRSAPFRRKRSARTGSPNSGSRTRGTAATVRAIRRSRRSRTRMRRSTHPAPSVRMTESATGPSGGTATRMKTKRGPGRPASPTSRPRSAALTPGALGECHAGELPLPHLQDVGPAAEPEALVLTLSPSTRTPPCSIIRSASDVLGVARQLQHLGDREPPAARVATSPPACPPASRRRGSAPRTRRAPPRPPAGVEARDDLLREHHLRIARVAAVRRPRA